MWRSSDRVGADRTSMQPSLDVRLPLAAVIGQGHRLWSMLAGRFPTHSSWLEQLDPGKPSENESWSLSPFAVQGAEVQAISHQGEVRFVFLSHPIERARFLAVQREARE